MMPLRPPVISVGQLYFHEDLQEYLVVLSNDGQVIRYSGPNNQFTGRLGDFEFIERFPPVDPVDLTSTEFEALQRLVDLPLQIGYIQD